MRLSLQGEYYLYCLVLMFLWTWCLTLAGGLQVQSGEMLTRALL